MTGRMAVAAARRGWLPEIFAIVGRVGISPSNQDSAGAVGDDTDSSKPKLDAPINSLILSTLLSALYILLGNFRALLTFNGLGEYTFFFLTVLGAIVLRFREPELCRPYKPILVIPGMFAAVSGFVVVRGAAFAPLQALVLVAVWLLGLVYYLVKKWWAGQLRE